MTGNKHPWILSHLAVSILLMNAVTAIVKHHYKRVLDGASKNIVGSNEVLIVPTYIRCLSLCTQKQCDGASWDEVTRECFLYTNLALYMRPQDTDNEHLKIFLPKGSQVTFYSAGFGNSWMGAKDDCESRGERLIHIHEEPWAYGTYDVAGNFLSGLQRDANGQWSDLFGTVVDESNVSWAGGAPSNDPLSNCLVRKSATGFENIDCNLQFNSGIGYICTDYETWRYP